MTVTFSIEYYMAHTGQYVQLGPTLDRLEQAELVRKNRARIMHVDPEELEIVARGHE